MEIHVPKLQEKFSVTFGQAFSSDITGDGPGSGKPLQLASIRDIGLDQPHKKVLVAGTNNSDGRPRNGRNKKVDFQKPKSGGRSNPDDFSERTVGDIGEGNKTLDTKSKHPAEVREEKRKAKQAMEKKLYLVQPADLPVIGKTILAPGWDGENAYTFSHEIGGRVIAINNITGKIVETVPHGITVKHVCRSAPGYVAVYGENHPDFGDGVDVKPVSATSTECVDLEFTLNGVVWEPARYRVFNPLLTYLRSKISTPNVSESQRHSSRS